MSSTELQGDLQLLTLIAESSEGQTLADLVEALGESSPTLKRRLARLRDMGANIAVVRQRGERPGYYVWNWYAIRPQALRWLEAENQAAKARREAAQGFGQEQREWAL